MAEDNILSDVFDEAQHTALLDLAKLTQDQAVEEAAEKVSERLAEEGLVEDEYLGLTTADRKRMAHNAKTVTLKDIWANSGVHPKTEKLYDFYEMCDYDRKQAADILEDTQFSTDQPLLIQRVVTEFVREAIEPLMTLTPMLQSMTFQHGTHIVFPATSAFYAEDIAEGTEYPEMELEWAGMVEATIGKVGVAVKFSEEMLKYSMWDVMSLHLREAGKALARHKERKVADLLLSIATEDFDNDAGTPTTGLSFTGAANGTFTLDDLLTMIANAVNEGWTPNTLIMNPMGWLIFARDPVMRAFGFANGGELWQNFQGNPGAAPQWKGGSLIQPNRVSDPQQVATTYTPVPSLFPFSPLTIVVSPFIPYNGTTQKTDIYLCDRSEIGYNIIEHGVVSDSWDDPARDLMKTKFKERYSIVGAVDSRVRVAKNISIAKSYDWDDRATWQAGTGSVPV